MSDENKAISGRFIDAFNAGNYDAIDDLVTPDWVSHDPMRAPDLPPGAEGIKIEIEGYKAAFPDLTITIEQQIAEGDFVVTRWSGRGTQRGELMGVSATGREAIATGITIDRIAHGKIAETWENWDALGLMRQLGAIPEPAATEA